MGCLKLTYRQEKEPLPFLGIWKKERLEKNVSHKQDALEEKKWQPFFCNSYTPFGGSFNNYERTASVPNRYKYNGKELQKETGLYDYGARYFDPAIARFINIDPAADNYQSWTPYHYVMNNPIIFIDPTGMFTELFNENGKKIGEDENGNDGNISIITDKK